MAVPHGIDRSGAAGGSGTQGMSGFLNDLADPGADRIIFWDDSDGDLDWLSLGTGLSITGTSLNLSSNLQNVSSLTPTDGGVIIGDGNSFVVESGATARASLGIAESLTPANVGEITVGRGSSNTVNVQLALAGAHLVNGRVTFSVSGSALVIALVQLNGSDASASNPIFVLMPQGVPADGTYTVRTVTGALSLVVSFGSTLGHTSGVPGPVHVYLLDNSGTIELAAGSPEVIPYGIVTTTAEGGAGGADSFTTVYSTAARASVPIVPVVQWISTQATAGTWILTTGEKRLYPWAQSVPAGTLLDFGGSNLPAGFLQCDGSAVSRTVYARLFAAISTTWGVGDGSTTFNVPDFRRRVAVGSGGSGTATLSNAIGATGGAETHTLTTAEMPAHTHTVPRGNTDGSGSELFQATVNLGTTTSSSAGGDGAHNNVQPSAVVLKIIKT